MPEEKAAVGEHENSSGEEEGEHTRRNLTIDVTEGTVAPNNTITLSVTLDGEPVPNATIQVFPAGQNPEELRTSSDGTVTITVPDADQVGVEAHSESDDAFGSKQLLGEEGEGDEGEDEGDQEDEEGDEEGDEEEDEGDQQDEEGDEEEEEGEQDDEQEDEGEHSGGNLTITVTEGTVAPNNTITLSVTLDGEPVPNATVQVSPAGPNPGELRTGSDGTVTITVPDANQVGVEAHSESEEASGSKQLLGQDGEEDERDREDEDDDREEGEEEDEGDHGDEEGDEEEEEQDDGKEEEREHSGGNLTITVAEGTVAPNNTITLSVTLDGEPVPNATVQVQPPGPNPRESRTDSSGTVTITVPDADAVEIEAYSESEEASGSKQLLGQDGEEDERDREDEDDDREEDEREDERDREDEEDEFQRPFSVAIQPPGGSPIKGESATFNAIPFGSTGNESYSWDFDGDDATDKTGQNVTYTFETAGDQEVKLTVNRPNGDNVVKTTTVTVVHSINESEIVDQSFTHLSGPMIHRPNLSVRISEGLVQISLINDSNPVWVDDLGPNGITTETRFEITVTVRNFHPKFMIGDSRDGEWTIDQVGDNTWRITIRGSPETIQYLDRTPVPTIENWPTENDQANVAFNPAMGFAVGNRMSSTNKGLYIGTDAQAFSTPLYIEEGGINHDAGLTIEVAGPHLTVNGQQNRGHYVALIPDSMLDAWNVSSADQLTAAYKGESKAFDATRVSDGIEIRFTLNYSSGTVAIRPQTDSSPDQNTSTNQPPSAVFNANPPNPTADQVVTFNGTSSTDPDGTIEKYSWDFDGDGETDSTGENVTHSFAEAGEYEVTLTVTDNDSATDSATDSVIVESTDQNGTDENATDTPGPAGAPPDRFAAFSETRSIPGNQATPSSLGGKIRIESQYRAATSIALKRNTSANYSLAITVTQNATNVTFYLQRQAVEASQNIDNVTMYLDNERQDFYLDENAGPGNSPWMAFEVDHFSTRTVSFVSEPSSEENNAPSASFSFSPEQPATNESVSFNASASSDPDGSIESYEWDFDGDGTTDSRGVRVVHEFAESGTFEVTLTVTDDRNGTDSASQTVTLESEETNVAPSPAFNYSPSSPVVHEAVTLDGTGSSDVDGEITRYAWDFNGDGTTEATGSSLTHTFNEAGSYEVMLTVTDDTNATRSVVQTITVGTDTTGSIFEEPIPGTGAENPPKDPDSDGLFEDVNGDGSVDFDDGIALAFSNAGDLTSEQITALDFDSDGDIDFDDAVELVFSA